MTAIDGTPLDDPQRGEAIMNTLQTAERATVTLVRGSQAQDLILDLAAVAAEAADGIRSAGAAAVRERRVDTPAVATR